MSKRFWRASTFIGLFLIFFAIIFALITKRILIEKDSIIIVSNIFFLSTVPLVISIITAVIYLKKNIYSAILIFCAMLTFAVGAILQEVIGGDSVNVGVTINISCIFICAVLHIITALYERISFPSPFIKHKIIKLALSFIIVCILILLIIFGSIKRVIPSFYGQNGYSSLAKALLSLTMVLYSSTFIMFKKHYKHLKIKLLNWYSYWLLMIALGLFLQLISNLDNVMFWVGRITFYVGSVFGIIMITEILKLVKQSESLYSKIMKYFVNVRSGSIFLESSDNAIIMVDEKFNIIFYNRPSKKIFRYNDEEVESQSILKLLILEPYNRLLASDFEKYKITGMSNLSGHTHEMKARDKEGREFPIEITIYLNKFVKKYSSTYIIKDITALKEIEKETKRQNTILNAIKLIHDSSIRCNKVSELYLACIKIVESVMDSDFCLIRRMGQDVYIHHAAFKLEWRKFIWSGEMSSDAWVGKEHLSKLLDSVLKDGKTFYSNAPVSCEHMGDTSRGHPKISSFLGVPIIKGSNTVGMIGVARSNGDYTKESREILESISPTIVQVISQKEVEEKLCDSEQRFHAFMDASPCVALMKDEEGKYVYFNKTWERAYGAKAKDSIGKTAYDLLPTKNADRVKMISEEILRSGKTIDANEEICKPGGKSGIWRMLRFPFVSISGRWFIGSIGLDITNTKSMELELKQHAKELEFKNKLITDFFINISHEFKTPISILQLAVDIANNKKENGSFNEDDHRRNLDIIKQNVYRLSKLVGNLLDITKIDAGFMQPKWETVDVVALLNNLVDSIKLFATKRDLELSFYSNIENKLLLTDSDFIERIVLNLVSNAIKCTQRGGQITIELSSAGQNISITVRDNGEGIPESKKDIIFDRFRQVNNSLARFNEGCGIGLSLTKSLVELLGGIITFKSEIGKGSDFVVNLPVKQTECVKRQVEKSESLETRIHMEFSDINFD